MTTDEYYNKINELHSEYHHLFEQDENGKILRGIEVDGGWLENTEKLLKSLEWHRTQNTYVPNPDYDPNDNNSNRCIEAEDHEIKIFQIKEKFGRYEVYVSYPLHIAEGVSETVGYYKGLCSLTCQSCGKVEKITPSSDTGWIRNVCEECKSEVNN